MTVLWRDAGPWAATLLGVAVLAGCGGTQDDSTNGSQTAATAQAAAGTVSGMSDTWVLLNGIKYNKTSAQVLDDDGQLVSASALQLGMQIDVQASQVDTAKAVGNASNIAFGASVEGQVDSVDAAAGQLVVLGQTFQVSDGTVFANGLSNGLADVAAGNFAKVQGVLDAKTGITAASRVEVKKSVRQLRLRGVTSELDSAAKTVKIGGQVVNFANAKVGVSLEAGQVVRSVLETEKVNGQFVAKQIGADRRFVADGDAVDVSAAVDEVTSPTSFKILGLAVDASNATITNGEALKVGARAEVKGALSGGKLVATSVTVKQSGKANAAELQGALSALDAAKRTFTLKDVAVSFNDKSTFVGGSAANLAEGSNVNVKGKLASGGTQLKAETIEILAN